MRNFKEIEANLKLTKKGFQGKGNFYTYTDENGNELEYSFGRCFYSSNDFSSYENCYSKRAIAIFLIKRNRKIAEMKRIESLFSKGDEIKLRNGKAGTIIETCGNISKVLVDNVEKKFLTKMLLPA